MNDVEPLIIHLFSFSYKQDIPGRGLGHGGGFYFDCRCLPNPGREEQYKTLTGLDPEVISFLEKIPAVADFFKTTEALVVQAVNAYKDRGFDSLVIGYGCTGGQHRSVYCAERLKRLLEKDQSVRVQFEHCQRERWPSKQGL